MNKYIFLFFLFLSSSVFSHSIVFVHIGQQIPSYLADAIFQARYFNEDVDIYVVGNKRPLKKFSRKCPSANVKWVEIETLTSSEYHNIFSEESVWNGNTWDAIFWRRTSERFFVLEELMAKYDLHDVIHLESDNLIYVDLNDILPIFKENYKGIGATFDHDDRCIAGLIYLAKPADARRLAKVFSENVHNALSDMEIIALLSHQSTKEEFDSIPTIIPLYAEEHLLKCECGIESNNAALFTNNIEKFNSIFDAGTFGPYFCGPSPLMRCKQKTKWINPWTVINPSFFTYTWDYDDKGRKVMYLNYRGERYRMNNLHVHSKKLYEFTTYQP